MALEQIPRSIVPQAIQPVHCKREVGVPTRIFARHWVGSITRNSRTPWSSSGRDQSARRFLPNSFTSPMLLKGQIDCQPLKNRLQAAVTFGQRGRRPGNREKGDTPLGAAVRGDGPGGISPEPLTRNRFFLTTSPCQERVLGNFVSSLSARELPWFWGWANRRPGG